MFSLEQSRDRILSGKLLYTKHEIQESLQKDVKPSCICTMSTFG